MIFNVINIWELVTFSLLVIILLMIFYVSFIFFVWPSFKKMIIRNIEEFQKINFTNNSKQINSEKTHFELIEIKKTFFEEWVAWVSNKQGNGLIIGKKEDRYKKFFRAMYFLNSKNKQMPSMYISDQYFNIEEINTKKYNVFKITNNGDVLDYKKDKLYKLNILSFLNEFGHDLKLSKSFLSVITEQIFHDKEIPSKNNFLKMGFTKIFEKIISYMVENDIELSFSNILDIWEDIPSWKNKNNWIPDSSKSKLSRDIFKIINNRTDSYLESSFDFFIKRLLVTENKWDNLSTFMWNKLLEKPFIFYFDSWSYRNDLKMINIILSKILILLKKNFNFKDSEDLLIFFNGFDELPNYFDIQELINQNNFFNIYSFLGVNTVEFFDFFYEKEKILTEHGFVNKYLVTPTENIQDIFSMNFSRRFILDDDYIDRDKWLLSRKVNDYKFKKYKEFSVNFKDNIYVSRKGFYNNKFKNQDFFDTKEKNNKS